MHRAVTSGATVASRSTDSRPRSIAAASSASASASTMVKGSSAGSMKKSRREAVAADRPAAEPGAQPYTASAAKALAAELANDRAAWRDVHSWRDLITGCDPGVMPTSLGSKVSITTALEAKEMKVFGDAPLEDRRILMCCNGCGKSLLTNSITRHYEESCVATAPHRPRLEKRSEHDGGSKSAAQRHRHRSTEHSESRDQSPSRGARHQVDDNDDDAPIAPAKSGIRKRRMMATNKDDTDSQPATPGTPGREERLSKKARMRTPSTPSRQSKSRNTDDPGASTDGAKVRAKDEEGGSGGGDKSGREGRGNGDSKNSAGTEASASSATDDPKRKGTESNGKVRKRKRATERSGDKDADDSKKKKAGGDETASNADGEAGEDTPASEEPKKRKKAAPKAAPKNARNRGARPTGPINLDTQCGVMMPNNVQCYRSLTCKTHSMALKRGVVGRTLPYDQLFNAYQARAQALRAQNGGTVPLSAAARQRAAAAAAANAAALSNASTYDTAMNSDDELETVSNVMRIAPPQPLAVRPRPAAYAKRRRQCFRMRELLYNAISGQTPDQTQYVTNWTGGSTVPCAFAYAVPFAMPDVSQFHATSLSGVPLAITPSNDTAPSTPVDLLRTPTPILPLPSDTENDREDTPMTDPGSLVTPMLLGLPSAASNGMPASDTMMLSSASATSMGLPLALQLADTPSVPIDEDIPISMLSATMGITTTPSPNVAAAAAAAAAVGLHLPVSMTHAGLAVPPSTQAGMGEMFATTESVTSGLMLPGEPSPLMPMTTTAATSMPAAASSVLFAGSLLAVPPSSDLPLGTTAITASHTALPGSAAPGIVGPLANAPSAAPLAFTGAL